MKAIITNKATIITDPTFLVRSALNSRFSYEDKSKQYQLKRMQKNTFMRNSPYYKKLYAEAYGSLLKELKGGHITFYSGLADFLPPMPIDDRRCETGKDCVIPWKHLPFPLRPYQVEAVDKVTDKWRGVINLATGLGKTLVALYVTKKIHKKTLIVVPSDSIAKQFVKEFSAAFGDHNIGIYSGNKKKIKNITIGIAASVVRNIDAFKSEGLGLIIFDEVHHIAANTFFNISTALGDVGRIYGMTATNFRSDGKDIMINAGCGSVVIERSINWGISNGFLAKPRFIINNVQTTGKNHKGDKLKNYKEHVLRSELMHSTIKNDIQTYMNKGLRVLALVAEIEHGERLAKELGLSFAKGTDKNSQTYVDQLNAGTIPGLIATASKLGEGTDTKNVDVIVMAQFMASKGPVLQAIGRGLRITPTKKECVIIDYVPIGSDMLTRHAKNRLKYYREITDDITIN